MPKRHRPPTKSDRKISASFLADLYTRLMRLEKVNVGGGAMMSNGPSGPIIVSTGETERALFQLDGFARPEYNPFRRGQPDYPFAAAHYPCLATDANMDFRNYTGDPDKAGLLPVLVDGNAWTIGDPSWDYIEVASDVTLKVDFMFSAVPASSVDPQADDKRWVDWEGREETIQTELSTPDISGKPVDHYHDVKAMWYPVRPVPVVTLLARLQKLPPGEADETDNWVDVIEANEYEGPRNLPVDMTPSMGGLVGDANQEISGNLSQGGTNYHSTGFNCLFPIEGGAKLRVHYQLLAEEDAPEYAGMFVRQSTLILETAGEFAEVVELTDE